MVVVAVVDCLAVVVITIVVVVAGVVVEPAANTGWTVDELAVCSR